VRKSRWVSLLLVAYVLTGLGLPVAVTSFSTQNSVLVTTSPQVTKISILNGAGIDQSSKGFSPNTVVVAIGVNNTVVWTDDDNKADDNGYLPFHTVTADDNSFRSGTLSSFTGNQFNYTFVTPGTFSYHCNVHSWMKGSVIVKGVAATSSSSSATTSTTPEFPLPYIAFLVALGVAAVAFRLTRGARANPPNPRIQ
jgi:plastocyanin